MSKKTTRWWLRLIIVTYEMTQVTFSNGSLVPCVCKSIIHEVNCRKSFKRLSYLNMNQY
jgi:hypothetical protein